MSAEQHTDRRCILTAHGTVSAIGRSGADMRDCLARASLPAFDVLHDVLPSREVLFAAVHGELPVVPERLARYDSRNSRLLLAAFAQISAQVEQATTRWGPQRVGVVLGTSTSGISAGEAAISQYMRTGTWPEGFDYASQEMGAPATLLAEYAGIHGPAYAISTACSSSARAIASARALIRAGICDAVVTGGVDSFCRMTIAGFGSLNLVGQGRTNPMSVNRDGINIGEAASLFVMSHEGEGPELVGAGSSSDAYHMSSPEPNGRGAIASMRAALEDAGLTPSDIAYVNLHGTGTVQNDAMESLAVKTVFGEVPCSSTKPLTGHTLGAAGAIELGLCWEMFERDGATYQLPVHHWDGEVDPAIEKVSLVTRATSELSRENRRYVLSNSFAFGGNNCSLILGARV